jgi:integrase
LKPDTISASVSLLFRNLKLPKGSSLHTLRHTHGSHLLAAGVPLIDVSKRLGHANSHVTATVYAHALPDRDDLAAAASGEVSEGRQAREASAGAQVDLKELRKFVNKLI